MFKKYLINIRLTHEITVANKGVPSITLYTVAESKLMINGLLITKSLWLGVKIMLLLNSLLQPNFSFYLANTAIFNLSLKSFKNTSLLKET